MLRRVLFVALLVPGMCAMAADFPALSGWSVEDAQREPLRRSIALMQQSTPQQRHSVRVLFYGQSITQQAWWKEVARYLQATYTNADFFIENRAIGGHSSQLLVKTAEADLYPFRPDLLIFHVYGSHLDYETLIRHVRERTCADILIATDHVTRTENLTEEIQRGKLSPASWDAWMNHVFLTDLAEKYSLCRADVRRAWKHYLGAHSLEPSALLKDSVHLNEHGEWLMAEIIKQHLAPLPKLNGYNPFDEPRVRTLRANLVGDAKSWVSEVSGRRVDLVFKPRATAPIHVRLDGRQPSANPALYGFTRVSPFPGSDWPLLLKVGSQAPLGAEQWKLTIHESAKDGSACRFTLAGSVGGEEGGDWSTNRFVSRSGRVVIEPADWNLAYCVKVFKRELPAGHVATFSSVLRGRDIAPPAVESQAVITVADGLDAATHRLELTGPALFKTFQEVRTYHPPLAPK